MKGSGLNSWSNNQFTHLDPLEHIFKPLLFLKEKIYVRTTVSRNETLVLSEEKKSMSNFIDHFFLSCPDNGFYFVNSTGRRHFLDILFFSPLIPK